MKTAIIDAYHILGTSSSRGVRLIYRGKTLLSLIGTSADNPNMLGAALKRAHSLGFTHWRNMPNKKTRNPIDPAIATWQGEPA